MRIGFFIAVLNKFYPPNEVGLTISKTEIYARTKHFLCRGKNRGKRGYSQ
jgi:hypothetical protein